MIFRRKKINSIEVINSNEGDYYTLAKSCQIRDLAKLYSFFLGEKKNGYFVELGGYDGESFSNTSGLADIGWSGIYIEPIEEYYLKCAQRHASNNVEVVRSLVGIDEGLKKIYKGGAISTTSLATLEKFKSFEWSKRKHNGDFELVESMKLDLLLKQNNCGPGFDVFSLDVEGSELNVLNSFDLAYWRPKMAIIEMHDNNSNYDNEWIECVKINNLFLNNDYSIIWKDLTNTIYLKNQVYYTALNYNNIEDL